MVAYLAAILIGLGLSLIGVLILGHFDPQRRQIAANLRLGEVVPETGEPIKRPSSLAEALHRITPAPMARNLDVMWQSAGRPEDWTMDKLLLIKYGAAVVGLLGGNSLNNLLKGGFGIALLIILPVLGFFVPELLMKSRAIERKQAIQLELPSLLDQMTIAVRAGLGFEQAMQRVAGQSEGPLAVEMNQAARDIRMGVPSEDAYKAMAARTGSDEVRRFVNAIVRAEKYGIAVSTVLNSQAQEMRVARRQRAERKAAQVPVQVTIPMMLLILPVLFLVILGPSVVKILGMM